MSTIAAKKSSKQVKLMELLTRLANVVTPDDEGHVAVAEEGRMAEVGYIAGRALTLARAVFRAPSAKGCKHDAAARAA